MQTKTIEMHDARYMSVAIRVGQRGLGRTAPNPSVGAVIVDPGTGEIISRGWTQDGGRPHAEPEAIARAGARAKGATMYVTLEPCSHHGRSPPCADAIIAAGISRVVVGHEDPDPRVAGRGLAMLREAGVAVVRGIERDACHALALGHILRVTERRPFVQLKMALGRDGLVPRGEAGAPTWVTGQAARAHGHLLRATSDAILIGAGTLIDDNPSLTCRLPGMAALSPVRVVLAGRQSIPANLNVITDGSVPLWWVRHGDAARPPVDTSQAEEIRVAGVVGRPWLPAVMEELVARGITRLLVEGGPTIWRAFDRAGLVDEIVMFHARGDSSGPLSRAEIMSHLANYVNRTPLDDVTQTKLANDDMIIFRRRSAP